MSGSVLLDVRKQIIVPDGYTTAASGAPPDSEAPLFECSLAENLGIRKFLIMSMEDLKGQMEQASRQTKTGQLPRKQFNQMMNSSIILTAWMTSALATCDAMLADAAARTPGLLSDELKDELIVKVNESNEPREPGDAT